MYIFFVWDKNNEFPIFQTQNEIAKTGYEVKLFYKKLGSRQLKHVFFFISVIFVNG